MAPVMLATQFLKVSFQQFSHLDDARSHSLDFAKPLIIEAGVGKDMTGYTCAVDWWIGVYWTDEDLDLGVDALLFFGRLADDRECANTFTVKTL